MESLKVILKVGSRHIVIYSSPWNPSLDTIECRPPKHRGDGSHVI